MHPLLTPQQAAAHLHDPGTVFLDATLPPVGVFPKPDMHAHYLAQHLPGAVFFDIDQLSDRNTTLPHMLPTPAQFAHDMEQLGLGDRLTFIVYEQGDVFSAPRAWWMLRNLGIARVFLLDGGLFAWREAGLPLEHGPVTRQPATFHAQTNAAAVRTFAEMQTLIHKPAQTQTTVHKPPVPASQILDARSAGRFHGTAPEPRPGVPSGHMPGALNLPYTELLDGPRLKAVPELRRVFAAHGVDLAQPVTTTCGSGVTAAVLALALHLCQAPDVTLYDGSWAEYAQHPDARIEPPPAR